MLAYRLLVITVGDAGSLRLGSCSFAGLAPERATPPFAHCARSLLGRLFLCAQRNHPRPESPTEGVGYSGAMVRPRGTSERRYSLPPVLPQPRRQQAQPGRFSAHADVVILLGTGTQASDRPAARRLQAGFEAAGAPRPLLRASPRPASRELSRIELIIDEKLGQRGSLRKKHDAYRLSVKPGCVEIRGATGPGLRYGVETLLQLLGPGGRIPCCRIEDGADLSMRGIMLDISRGKVPRRASLEELIDTCVALKLNVLMLYTEHTFRFRKHPRIGRDASPLNARTLSALEAYAAERFVELVPCLQSLGHMEHILRLPAYRAMAETESGWTIAPRHPRTLPFLRDLYDEYLPLFRSRWFNANCDEPWDLGRGQSKKRSERLGPGGLYLEHVHRIQRLARKHGKRTMIWADVVHAHPKRISEIDPNLVLLDWWYEADFDFTRAKVFARNELDFLVCPGTSSWNSLFPRVANSLANISGWAKAGRRHGALGLLNTDWGDHGHYNLQGNSLLAYAWGAQEAWSGTSAAPNFDRAFSRLFFGDPRGEVARLYRDLGAIHEPGFKVFNGSPLQYLFFDSVESAYFIGACKASRIGALQGRLERLAERIERVGARATRGAKDLDEVRYAADASSFALRKADAGLEYLAWRHRPASLGSPGRQRLAAKLSALASEQIALGRRLRSLWLARAQPSNLESNLERLRRSARHLRSAARKLEANRPSPPAVPKPISVGGVLESVRESMG